jgi:hypothetical protein
MKFKMTLIILALLLGSLVLAPGCTEITYWPAMYDRVISDGEGGAIVLYDILRNSNRRDIYAQRLSPDGHKLWGEKGTLIGTADKKLVSAVDIRVVSDNRSGAFLVWTNTGYKPGERSSMVIKLDSEGKIPWQQVSGVISDILADGQGGILTSSVKDKVISVNRISYEGNKLWCETGVSFTRPKLGIAEVQFAADGEGGIIIAWLESDPQRAKSSHPGTTEEIYARRIDAGGNLDWGKDGVQLYVSLEDTAAASLRISRYSPDGLVLAWEQFVTVVMIGDSQTFYLNDICAQKIDLNGINLWQRNGVTLDISRTTGITSPPIAPLVVADDSGGAIVMWQDLRVVGRPALYAQKINDKGNIAWSIGGTKVFDIDMGEAYRYQMTESQEGGVIVSLTFRDLLAREHGIRIHELDGEGHSTWLVEPVNITVDLFLSTHDMVSDSHGDVFLAWGTTKTAFSSSSVSYVQKIDGNGNLLWGEDGIRLDK